MATPSLILVDGSSYLYRAFFASQQADLRTSEGLPSGAVRIVTSMMRSLVGQYPDSRIAVIFDAKGKTFRDDIYPEYKANRPSMPDDLRAQIEPIHNIIRAMGFPLIAIEGVEADDVIGTYAAQATVEKTSLLISTGDKDMAQLVNEHVTLINTMNDTLMDVEGVNEKFGIPPELIIDYLALMGDKVDNIPGVPGVGEKTALALLQGIGSIESLYQNLDKIADLGFRGSKTMAKKLADNKEFADLSYLLATIKLDVEMELSIGELQNSAVDKDALLPLFKKYEFKSWIAELESGKSVTPSTSSLVVSGATLDEADENFPAVPANIDYQIIYEKEQFNLWLAKLTDSELFSFDTETDRLDYMEAQLIGLSFSVKAGEAAYVPLAHDYVGAPDQLDRDWVLGQLKPLLENADLKKVGQHMKFDMNVLTRYDISLRGVEFDTMLESYILNSTATRHDMDSLANKYLGVPTTKFEELAGKGKKQLTFNQIDVELAGHYAAEDADITLRLHHAIGAKLAAIAPLNNVFHSIEKPLIPVLARIEQNGALVNPTMLAHQSLDIAKRLTQLEVAAHEAAGQVFNLSSPKQLQEILFEKLGLPVKKKTPKGVPSTAEEVLVDLAETYELPKLLLEYRGLAKLKSTYTDKLPLMINGRTKRIHTSYHQAVAATGRLSSTDPNLQNIPIRSEQGRKIRQAFVTPAGYKMVAADYSQIELRIMAHLSGDEGLLNAFNHGDDVHKVTASEVFKVAIDEVTIDQRRSAKAINFGLIYGMSAFGLAKQLGIGRVEAKEYIEHYFATYPSVQNYMQEIREKARDQGYVETVFGRRLYLPGIKASNALVRQGAERTAINAPMQGTAADIIKRAMLAVDAWLAEGEFDAKMVMQVHDELVFEVAEGQVTDFTAKVLQIMQDAASLDVPLIVEAGVGDNWDEAH
ncbi:MAG: DNA polymerase I [Oceanospirillaceae bacterium]